MKIQQHSVVSINYTLRDDAGNILDSSDGREPLAYIHGMGNIIPGLEASLENKTAGESIQVTVAPAEAYGEFDAGQIAAVPRSQFSGIADLEVGMQFTASGPQGDQMVTITKIEGDTVTVDGNHPLAGMTLHFDVSIVNVRIATAEELEHGHVHGAGGHHH
ncbi:MAG: peptidylprolyl isomerase [Bacteroidota bacterium]|jgi:FKBP-type peptidyl-prolyl cis-trans isomerase SlyD